eukprot:5740444-Ditylum_brightwellii.AAC.1
MFCLSTGMIVTGGTLFLEDLVVLRIYNQCLLHASLQGSLFLVSEIFVGHPLDQLFNIHRKDFLLLHKELSIEFHFAQLPEVCGISLMSFLTEETEAKFQDVTGTAKVCIAVTVSLLGRLAFGMF